MQYDLSDLINEKMAHHEITDFKEEFPDVKIMAHLEIGEGYNYVAEYKGITQSLGYYRNNLHIKAFVEAVDDYFSKGPLYQEVKENYDGWNNNSNPICTYKSYGRRSFIQHIILDEDIKAGALKMEEEMRARYPEAYDDYEMER